MTPTCNLCGKKLLQRPKSPPKNHSLYERRINVAAACCETKKTLLQQRLVGSGGETMRKQQSALHSHAMSPLAARCSRFPAASRRNMYSSNNLLQCECLADCCVNAADEQRRCCLPLMGLFLHSHAELCLKRAAEVTRRVGSAPQVS